MKVHVHYIDTKQHGGLAILRNYEADEAEVCDNRSFSTKNEAREAATKCVLHQGGFEDGELISEIALRLGWTHTGLTQFIESSEFPVAVNVGIQTAIGYGLMPRKQWTLDYLGASNDG